jgi:hypothetical protein
VRIDPLAKVQSDLLKAFDEKDVDEVKKILKQLEAKALSGKEATVYIIHKVGKGILQLAAENGLFQMTTALIEAGFEIDRIDDHFGTALQVAGSESQKIWNVARLSNTFSTRVLTLTFELDLQGRHYILPRI